MSSYIRILGYPMSVAIGGTRYFILRITNSNQMAFMIIIIVTHMYVYVS